ncbi:MAG: carbohydrate ABC transporter substrate-binding protein [Acetatifactor sp.]|nr:carbohydrate ABC transporter substrate-binding protein [Acetatifactor sp.]
MKGHISSEYLPEKAFIIPSPGKAFTVWVNRVLLAFLLSCILTGCGKGTPDDEDEKLQSSPKEEFLWQQQELAEVTDITDGSPIYIVDYQESLIREPDFEYDWRSIYFYGQVNDKLYMLGQYVKFDESDDSKLKERKYYWHSYDLISKERQCTELAFDISELPYFYIDGGEVIGEDEIVFFYPHTDGETVENYYAVYTNAQGELLRMQDIYPAMKEFGIELEVALSFSGMACDGRGYLYVCDPKLPRVGVIDETGALIDTMEVMGDYDSGPSCSVRSPEGIPIFELYSTREKESTLFWYDPDKSGMHTLTRTSYMGMSSKCMNQYGEIYFNLLDKIVRWDTASGKRERIFDCKSNGIGANSFMLRLLTDSGGNLYAMEFSSGALCLYEFSEKPVEKTSNITITDLWGLYNNDLRACAASFSRKNPSCYIGCEGLDNKADYSERQAYRDRIIAELVSGKGPEMLLVDGSDLKLLYEKGVLADLSDVFPAETREQIFTSILEAGTFDGKLVGLASFSSMETVFVSKDVWTKDTWTVEELVKLVEDRGGELESIFVGELDGSDVFYDMAMMDLENTPFIDWDKKKCYFDGELFRKVLELSMKYSKKDGDSSFMDGNDYSENERKQREALHSGKALAYVDNFITGLNSFSHTMALLGEDYFYVGFPTDSGNGSYFYANTFLVVNKEAKNKDTIYQFIQYFYNVENQRSVGVNTVRKDVLSSYVVYPDWTTGAEFSMGNGVYEVLTCKPDGTSYLEEYLEFVETCVRQPPGTEAVRNIILEEVAYYFDGAKDIDKTVDTIQRRVQVYLDEQ